LDDNFPSNVVLAVGAFSPDVVFLDGAISSFGFVRTAVIFDLTKSFLAEPCCIFTFIIDALFNGFLGVCIVGFGVLGNFEF
jgi:hypothetical protein